MVHGYIAQCKGIPINWTKAAKSTTKEKTCRGEMSKGQTTTKKERSSDSCDAMNPNAEGLWSYLQHSTKLTSDYEGTIVNGDNNE